MEHIDMGAITSEGEWNVNYVYSTNEEADFMAQLLGNCSVPNEQLPDHVQESDLNMNMNISSIDENSICCSEDNAINNSYCFSQSSSFSNLNLLFPSSSSASHENGYCPNDTHHFLMQDTSSLMLGDDFLYQDFSNINSMASNENMNESILHGTSLHLEMEHDQILLPQTLTSEEENGGLSNNAKKRCRVPSDNLQKNKRNLKPKKNKRVTSSGNDGEDQKKGNVLHRQNSMNCSSEEDDDDDDASQELSGVTSSLTSKGRRARATRGSATDPQSLYARKRREKINERLKILQTLVPNGTKVDISTMLEEAVQYVNFLQLQIKLLSSNDKWMYSPIAYNGMDIGLDMKFPTSKS